MVDVSRDCHVVVLQNKMDASTFSLPVWVFICLFTAYFMSCFCKMFVGRSGNSRKEVIVFTRYPIPGKAKTRMIPAIGSVAAAKLQALMVLWFCFTLTSLY